jgi:hypothetical protein
MAEIVARITTPTAAGWNPYCQTLLYSMPDAAPCGRARPDKLLTVDHCNAEIQKRQADSWRGAQQNNAQKSGAMSSFCHLFSLPSSTGAMGIL